MTPANSEVSLGQGGWPEELLQPLQNGFLASARVSPDRPALEVSGRRIPYSELRNWAASLAATLQAAAPADPAYTAVYASRSPAAYCGILAALLRGHGYVPLNPRFPADRNAFFLQRTGAQALIVDAEGEKTLGHLIGDSEGLIIVLPHRPSVSDLRAKWPQHRFVGANELRTAAEWRQPEVELDAVAYVLFTSGSTGEPKGVMITHRNISHLLRTMVSRYKMDANDRVSQFADLTFDPSVFDVFAAWECGGCVCCPDAKTLLNPSSFLVENGITIFQSVPSNGLLIKRLGGLKPGRFPKLRVSLFGGEALPMELCRDWQAAAPNSILENLYGPTEVTINSTAYRWHSETSPAECEHGFAPIGALLPGVQGMVVDEEFSQVADGEKGQFLLAGPQRTPGYLGDSARTKGAFVIPQGARESYYRTGDLVSRVPGKGYYAYHGRLDFQVKVFGMRIELGEVEAALKAATGGAEAAAIGWPVTPTGVGGIVAFIAGPARPKNQDQVKEALRRRLPPQMVPRAIRFLEKLPLNHNGKIDRLALRRSLDSSV